MKEAHLLLLSLTFLPYVVVGQDCDTGHVGYPSTFKSLEDGTNLIQVAQTVNSGANRSKLPSVHGKGVELSESISMDAKKIKIVVENKADYKIEQLMVIHKYLGLKPPTTVLQWTDLEPGTITEVREVMTEVGATALRNDWWLATWTFAKSGGKCPGVCEKKDGTCASWLTTPTDQWIATLLDPTTYVKAAVTAANIAISAATLGTGTMIAATLGTMLTDQVATSMLSEDNIDAFKACGIKEATFTESDRGKPMKIVIQKETDEAKAVIEPLKIVIEQFEGTTCDIGASSMPCKAPKRQGGKDVGVKLKSGSKEIEKAALLHRYTGLDPSLAIMSWGKMGMQSLSGESTTQTKTYSMANDMWMLVWQEKDQNEGDENECKVMTTAPGLVWENLKTAPGLAVHTAAVKAGDLIVGKAFGIITDFAEHAHSHAAAHPSMTMYGWDKGVEDLMGKEGLFHLASTDDSEGFIKCNLQSDDLKDKGADPITVEIKGDEVEFKFHGRTCKVPAKEQCIQKKGCETCKVKEETKAETAEKAVKEMAEVAAKAKKELAEAKKLVKTLG